MKNLKDLTKSFWKSIKSNLSLVLSILLVFVLVFIGYQCGVTKEAKRTARIFMSQADETKKDAEKIIKEKEKENKQLEKINLEKDKIIAKVRSENEDLVVQQKRDEIQMEKLKEEIAKEKPDELISRARMLLATEEIWWNRGTEKVEFSLESFRTGVTKWADWADFTLKREPNYLQQIQNAAIIEVQQNEKILNLSTEIGNFKVMLQNQQTSYVALGDAFSEFRRFAKKKGGLLENVLWGIAGYGFGKLCESVLVKK